jgi:hypothetical protein
MHDRQKPSTARGGSEPRISRSGRLRCSLSLAAMLSIASSAAFAEESMFAYVYTTDRLP